MHHRLLLVDDDVNDQFLTARALKKILPPASRVIVLSSGNEAIRYLIGEGEYGDRRRHPFPSFLISDLNMKDGDGFSLLQFIQWNPAWSVMPRIVFSCSNNDDDVRTAFMLGASAFHIKPVQPRQNAECLRRIVEYWATSLVPPVDENGRILPTTPATRGVRYPQQAGGPSMQRPPDSAGK